MKLLFISAAINEKWNHLDGLFSVLAVLYTCVFLFVIVDLFFGVRRARQLKIIRTLRLPRRLCHPCNLSFARVQHHRKNHNPLGTSCRKQHGTLHCKRRKMVGHPPKQSTHLCRRCSIPTHRRRHESGRKRHPCRHPSSRSRLCAST